MDKSNSLKRLLPYLLMALAGLPMAAGAGEDTSIGRQRDLGDDSAHRLAFERNPTNDAGASRPHGLSRNFRLELIREAKCSREFIGVTFSATDQPTVRSTQPYGCLYQGIEHIL